MKHMNTAIKMKSVKRMMSYRSACLPHVFVFIVILRQCKSGVCEAHISPSFVYGSVNWVYILIIL